MGNYFLMSIRFNKNIHRVSRYTSKVEYNEHLERDFYFLLSLYPGLEQNDAII